MIWLNVIVTRKINQIKVRIMLYLLHLCCNFAHHWPYELEFCKIDSFEHFQTPKLDCALTNIVCTIRWVSFSQNHKYENGLRLHRIWMRFKRLNLWNMEIFSSKTVEKRNIVHSLYFINSQNCAKGMDISLCIKSFKWRQMQKQIFELLF